MEVLLKARTTKAAKQQVKRLYPKGGTITGYEEVYPGEDKVVYFCIVQSQSSKLPGGRTAFSDRRGIIPHPPGKYPKGTDTSNLYIKPDYFKVRLHEP